MPRLVRLLLLSPLVSCTLLLEGVRSVCGDGFLQRGEDCDDGDADPNDGCDADCHFTSACGDGAITPPEACDDGNLLPGDGCDDSCQIEIPIGCGDGAVGNNEECDEGPNNSQAPNAICRTNCQLAGCGDTILDDLRGETCDDGNNLSGDGCSVICLLEDVSICGDGFPEALEECDDGNTNNNDGCDADCNPSTVIQISAGGAHTCALLRSGDVRCWGEADNGRLGYGNLNDIGDDELPNAADIVDVGGEVSQIVAGRLHTCALLVNGDVRCWGASSSGLLGQGLTLTQDLGDDETPSSVPPVDLGEFTTRLAVGDSHTCALSASGSVRCWGIGALGRLGYGNETTIGDNELPSIAGSVSLGRPATHLTAGDQHSCAILNNNTLRCWGNNGDGQLGLGSTTLIGNDEVPDPQGTVIIDSEVALLSAGDAFTCALIDGGEIKCWGLNNFGQLGRGNNLSFGNDAGETPLSLTPINFSVQPSAFQIDAGNEHVCAVFEAGVVRCWGNGANGRLGYGNLNNIGDNDFPGLAVSIGEAAAQVSAGGEHTCALLTTGQVRCWGNGANGRLGYGDNASVGDNEAPSTAGDVPLF